MKRFIAAAVVAGLCGGCAATYEKLPPEKAGFEITYKTKLPKDTVFAISMQWLARTFTSAKDVIEYQDKAAGKIIGHGRTTITAGKGVAEVSVTFKMELSIKEGGFSLVMDNATAFWGEYHNVPRPVKGPADAELVNAKFAALCESLNTEINKRDDAW
jgi:hypothetical protein